MGTFLNFLKVVSNFPTEHLCQQSLSLPHTHSLAICIRGHCGSGVNSCDTHITTILQ